MQSYSLRCRYGSPVTCGNACSACNNLCKPATLRTHGWQPGRGDLFRARGQFNDGFFRSFIGHRSAPDHLFVHRCLWLQRDNLQNSYGQCPAIGCAGSPAFSMHLSLAFCPHRGNTDGGDLLRARGQFRHRHFHPLLRGRSSPDYLYLYGCQPLQQYCQCHPDRQPATRRSAGNPAIGMHLGSSLCSFRGNPCRWCLFRAGSQFRNRYFHPLFRCGIA